MQREAEQSSNSVTELQMQSAEARQAELQMQRQRYGKRSSRCTGMRATDTETAE
jgi:hypothetical protein